MNKRKGRSYPRSNSAKEFIAGLARERGELQIAKRFLIVCEDDKSSPNYFNSLIGHLRLATACVSVVGSDGRTQPTQVVEQASKLKKEAEDSNSATVPYDEVWAIIDGDYGKKIVPARKLAKTKEVKMGITTPCFEYWVLLHFEDFRQSQLDCNGIIKQLKNHLPNYDKGKERFSDLVNNYQTAAERAHKGRSTQKDELPENISPCSELFLLTKSIDKSVADSSPK